MHSILHTYDRRHAGTAGMDAQQSRHNLSKHPEGVAEVILPDVHAIRMSDNDVYQ